MAQYFLGNLIMRRKMQNLFLKKDTSYSSYHFPHLKKKVSIKLRLKF